MRYYYSSKSKKLKETFENELLLDDNNDNQEDNDHNNKTNKKKTEMVCQRTSWNIVYLMGIFSLIQNTQYSIYLTTMWAYLKKLDPTATESQYGFIVAMSSLGHCFGCLLLGYWNGKTGKSAPSMYCGFLLMLASNIVYLFIDYLPSNMVFYAMMFSRLLGGFGMGNSSPMRTCASLHSTSADRSKAMASISGGRSVGTVVGPGLQLIFLPLGETGIKLFFNTSLHSNNAPAFLGIFLTVIGFLSLVVLFNEDQDPTEEMDKVAIADYDHHYRTVEVQSTYPDPDKLAMFICMLTRFVQNFMQIAIESLAQILFMMMFLQSREQAVATMATTYLTTGLIATVLYLLIIFTPLSKYVRDKIFNTGVLFVFIAHLLCTYSWSFYKENVDLMSQHRFSNHSQIGCDSSVLDWCQGLTKFPEWIFYAGYICSFGLFMPFINVANATLYSKLLNPDSQGTHQSLYDISNTTARIFAPILITVIYTAYGPRRAWEFMIVLLSITASLWIIFDKRLVPLKPIETKHIFENDGFETDKSSKSMLVI